MTDSSPPLNQAFVERLRRLARHLGWHLTRGAEGNRGAVHRRTGGASTFEGHRAYTPGDDPRGVDWHAFARNDQLVVKLFRRDTEAIVDVLIDRTASMAVGANADRALSLAAAVGFLGAASGHRVRIGLLGANGGALVGPYQGVAQAEALVADLGGIDAPAAGDLAAALRDYAARVTRPGAVVVVTDGLAADAAALARPLERLGRRAGEATLFHCVAADDLAPTLDGPVEIEDAETGAVERLAIDANVRARYRALVGAMIEGVGRAARRAGVDYRFVDPDASIEDVIIAWHRGRVARGV